MQLAIAFSTIVSVMVSKTAPKFPFSWNNAAVEYSSPNGLDGVVLTITRVVAILSAYQQIQCINKIGMRKVLFFTVLLAAISSFVFFILVSYIFAPIQVNIIDILPFFILLLDVPKTVCLGQRVFAAQSTSRYVYRIALASAFQNFGPLYFLNFVVSISLLAMGLILNLKYLKLVCLLSIICVSSIYACFMTIYPALLVLFSEVCLYGCKPASKHHEFIIDCRDIDCSFMTSDTSSTMMKVKALISVGSIAVHVLIYYLNPSDCAYSLCKTAISYDEHIYDLHAIADRETIDLIYGYSVETEPVILLVLAISLAFKFALSESYSPSSNVVQLNHTDPPSQIDLVAFVVGSDSTDGAGGDNSIARRRKSPSMSNNIAGDQPVVDRTVSWSSGGQMDDIRSFAECSEILENEGLVSLADLEIVMLIKTKKVQAYSLEQRVDSKRAVAIRRELISQQSSNSSIFDLPYMYFDYDEMRNACCENVIGYVQLPVGVVGPLTVNDQPLFVPLATTEGALVASTNRGCKALHQGVRVVVNDSGMTRAPAVKFPTIVQADVFCNWFKNEGNIDKLRAEISEDSKHTKLVSVTPTQSGKHVFLRFQATTGDAMGMNMVSKAVEKCLLYLKCEFTSMKIITVSGNMCTDKKPSAINWILGRGKKVVAEAVISKQIVQSVLKTQVDDLVELNIVKNLLGSTLAGSIGGFNAHAANIITAIFIATGQDPAQVVESSNCTTYMEKTEDGNLSITCTLPCLEVGTLGGGTMLPAQKAALKMLNVQGSTSTETASNENAFSNAKQLAAIIGSCVVAGELSLLSALSTGDLVKSHLKLNRSNKDAASQ